MKYVLGIDQGGSKTHTIVADETGKLLGMGKSYGACHSSSSLEYATQAILEASDQALVKCGLRRSDIAVAVGGLTGVDWNYEAELLKKEVEKHFPKANVKIVNDSIIAMRAATRKSCCGILCAGSGLNCAVQSGEDSFVYGFYIPDEYQGGWSLGRKAMQAVFDAYLGLSDDTTLTGRLLEHFGVKTVDELLFLQVKKTYSDEKYLQIPRILEEEALQGDRTAVNIWLDYGKAIVRFLAVRMEKMGIQKEPADIVLSGSIFKCRLPEFRDIVKEEIRKKLPNASIIEAGYEPVMGAVVMGFQELHGKITEKILDEIENSSIDFPVRRLETS